MLLVHETLHPESQPEPSMSFNIQTKRIIFIHTRHSQHLCELSYIIDSFVLINTRLPKRQLKE